MHKKNFSGKTRSLGISRLEIGFFALLIVFGGLLVVTKYLDLSILLEDSMDQGVVRAVRQGIAAYAVESQNRGSPSLYPPVLDDAETGAGTPHNLFFSNVLPRGIAVEGWEKAGQYEYRAPIGEKFFYDPRTGSFETHGNLTETGIGRSSQTPQSDAGVQ